MKQFVIKAYDGEGKKESDGNEYMDFKGKMITRTAFYGKFQTYYAI